MEDRVDALDGGRHGLRVTDVALNHLEPRMSGEQVWCSIEGADLVPAVEQFGHEVGADEAGAPVTSARPSFVWTKGAEGSGVNDESPMPQSITETCYSLDSLGENSFWTQLSS